jgi:hypothetical protein
MGDFYLHRKKITTVFQVLTSLGTHENDMSRSVAWALGQCPRFLRAFVRAVTRTTIDAAAAEIRLQVFSAGTGITDVEIISAGKAHIIVEAKRGFTLPSRRQLSMYAGRLRGDKSPARCLVALTDCPRTYASAWLRTAEARGIPVVHISWAEVADIADRARKQSRSRERYLLDELIEYLRGVATMQQVDSNWVYVLALRQGTPKGWKVSWIEVVTKKRRYFHPVGVRGWPATPPNYLAFRYYGELQSVHHVEGYEVVSDAHELIPEIPAGEVCGEPYFIYRLGPAFRPARKVPSRIPFAGRRWCMLDTLFTCRSIREANLLSTRRQSAAQQFAPK